MILYVGVTDLGVRYMQLKDNETVDSGRLKGDRVRYLQVTAIYRLTAVKREKFAKNKKNTSKKRLSYSRFKV